MEITRSNKIAFAYTVKSLGSDNNADYKPFFDKLERFKIPVEYKIHEMDSKSKIHYHGIIYLDKGFYRRRLTTKGFAIKLDEIYNKAGWVKYIHKDVSPEDWPDTDDEFIDDYTPTVKPTKRLF